MKKFAAILLTLCMVFSLAACGESGETGGDEAVSLALVVAGTFGDRSFYDSSKEGADQLAAENESLSVTTIECNGENHDSQIRNAADVADIVVLVGWEFYNVETIAPEYPDVKFIWIDNATGEPVENLLNIVYAQNEGSFLAGYIAAATSESGVVGAVGGEDSDTINDFIVGYRQGAEYYAAETGKEITVEVNYSNSYDDPALGKECAIALNDLGADVVFQIASACGDGVFEAAEERGFWAIGVDSDQTYISESILCSMQKQVGKSIYDAVSAWLAGDESSLGTTWTADMSAGYIGIGYGEADGIECRVDAGVVEAVEALAGQIASGEIEVNTAFAG